MEYQRLSDHILLGDSLRQRNSEVWLMQRTDRPCGWCNWRSAGVCIGKRKNCGIRIVLEQWPWLDKWILHDQAIEQAIEAISRLFRRVCAGKMTIEALADQVRSWEDEFDDALKASLETTSAVAQEDHVREKEEISL